SDSRFRMFSPRKSVVDQLPLASVTAVVLTVPFSSDRCTTEFGARLRDPPLSVSPLVNKVSGLRVASAFHDSSGVLSFTVASALVLLVLPTLSRTATPTFSAPPVSPFRMVLLTGNDQLPSAFTVAL